MDHDHTDAQSFGGLVGIVLSGAIVYFSVTLAATANIEQHNGYSLIGLYYAFVAAVIGVLVLINLGTTVYLIVKSATLSWVLALMWLVPLVASMTYPILVSRDKAQRDALARAHPEIAEYHVNLTGHPFWLLPQLDSQPVAAGTISYVSRKQTLEDRDDPMAEYAGERVAPGFTHMKVFFSAPPGARPTTRPVIHAPWPELSAVDRVNGAGPWVSRSYHYFHYRERVEVVPTFSASAPHDRREAIRGALLDVYPHNLSGSDIARIEIDGQDIGLAQAIASPDEKHCKTEPNSAINSLAAPLKIRWQNVRTLSQWQEATVAVPSFQQAHTGKQAVRSNAVHLYFMADGSVAAQRVQELLLGDEHIGVRITDAAALASADPCGGAASHYDASVQRLGH